MRMRATIFVSTRMNIHYRTLHLALASSVAVAFIVCAYLFSGPFSFRPTTVDAATAETLLKAYATKDSDSDGLPDWQETLYGTDPANPQSVQAGLTDGEAVAQGLVKPKFQSEAQAQSAVIDTGVADDSITAQFAREFFTEYLTTYGGSANLTNEQLTAFTEQAVQKLVANHRSSPAFSASKTRTSGTGTSALRTYATLSDSVFSKNTVQTEKSELEYLSDALEKNDASALLKLKSIGKTYTALGVAFIKIPVPVEARDAHIRVANAFATMGEVVSDMGSSSSDPLRSMLGLMLYRDATVELAQSLANLYTVFDTSGVVFTENDSGYTVYRLSKFAHDALTETP